MSWFRRATAASLGSPAGSHPNCTAPAAHVRRRDAAGAVRTRRQQVEVLPTFHAAIDYADPGFGELDSRAVAALLDGLGDRATRMLYLSSTLVYGDTGDEVVTEDRDPAPLVQPFKLDGERLVRAAGGVVLRPGLVYGYSGSALLDGMRAAARQHGAVSYVGHGTNRWSVVHADDLGELVRLALEKPASGQVLNAAAAAAPSMREIAATIAATEGVAAVPLAVEQAAETMGDSATQLTRNLVADATRARDALKWRPEAPPLLQVLAHAEPRAA